jgi:hypothetical protein
VSALADERLLANERTLLVLPRVARSLGRNEALTLQALHTLTGASERVADGHPWVRLTLDEWREQFPFWSKSTIKRAFRSLRESGLVVVAQLSRESRTNWYRLDYDAVAKALGDEAAT